MFPLLNGTWSYRAGAAGTETIPPGATLASIVVHATGAGTVTIFGGPAIPIIAGAAPTEIRFAHHLATARNNTAAAGSQNIVFTGTDSYFLEFATAGNQ